MSRMRPLLAAALLLLLAVPAAAGESAADSAYRDYRIPDHRWWQWVAGVSASAEHSDQSLSPDRTNRSGSLFGQLTTSASGGHETDLSDQSWAATVRFDGARQHTEQFNLDTTGEITGEFSDRALQELISLGYDIRVYPWSFPLALSAGTTQSFDFQQRFSSADFERRSPAIVEQTLSSSTNGTWFYRAGVRLGTGVGRVRDATPVYQARILEDRLLETGTLARPLSRAARERLAALFATSDRFGYAHGRPDKYFWGELERVLAEDSALANGSIDLYDAHRILEPVTLSGRVLRRTGWFVGPALFLISDQRHLAQETAQSYAVHLADTLFYSSGFGSTSSDYARQDRVQTEIVAEYHHPAGHRWQYDAGHTTRLGESGVPANSLTSASVMWTVSDRWLATGFVGHLLEWNGHGTNRGVERWEVSARVDVSYFVEDSWALTVSAREGQTHGPNAFQRRGVFAFSITRVISGLFDAPGLVNAMRPTPGGL